jgi:hypothetical protein
MTLLEKYQAACNYADSIYDTEDDSCEVVQGGNGGYFVFAFGKKYRFACLSDPKKAAQLFVDIVAIGPVHKFN